MGAESLTNPSIQHFYDEPTGTLSYVVADVQTGKAAIVDCVLGYSLSSGRTDTSPADIVLETHAHADHLSAAQYVKAEIGGTVGIRNVQ